MLFPAVKHMQLEKDSGKCGHFLFRDSPLSRTSKQMKHISEASINQIQKLLSVNKSCMSFLIHYLASLVDRPLMTRWFGRG